MLEITTPESEVFYPSKGLFVTIPSCVLTLEHSLISLAKWESKWRIPYLNNSKLTREQDLDYIKCMVIGTVKDERVFEALTAENFSKIRDYMEQPMTAATFTNRGNSPKNPKKIITAEVIYCRMFANNIPMECQKWHLNRLLALLRACEITNGPPEKMSKRQTAMRNAELNAARRAKYSTRG